MSDQSAIEWCDATFNPWWGCERVSPGCAYCYADTFARRFGMDDLWVKGDEHGFRFFGDKHWAEPLKWARTRPEKLGRRPRVFCASMADVFEEHPALVEPRKRLFNLIADTPELDWLILTKRPEYARDLLASWQHHEDAPGEHPLELLSNVWLGVSIENARYTWRADVLREIPAAVRFISAEPLLGSLYTDSSGERAASHSRRRGASLALSAEGAPDDQDPGMEARTRAPLVLTGIDWVIIGGESGPGARPFYLEHARELVAYVKEIERPYENGDRPAIFVKQLGANAVTRNAHGDQIAYVTGDRKGGDPLDWPPDLRIREFPRTPQGRSCEAVSTTERAEASVG